MGFRRMARATVAVGVAMLLTLTACTTQPGDDGDHTLTVGYTTEPDGLDPSTVEGAATSFMLLYNVYETLVKDDGEGNIVGLLASDWDVSDDGRTYTFHLVQNARFHDGTSVTPAVDRSARSSASNSWRSSKKVFSAPIDLRTRSGLTAR